MGDLYVVGGTALTLNAKNDIVEDAVVHVKDGKIVSVGTSHGFSKTGKRVVDATNCLVMPGLVNGHTHTGMTLLRGFADDLPLHQWLEKGIFPVERRWSSPDFVYFGSTLAALEMIRSGTTTCNDMYYYEVDAARAYRDAGIRAVAGQSLIEISGVGADADAVLAEFDRFLDGVVGMERITPSITPHSIYGLSAGMWKRVIDYAEKHKLLVHTHISETEQENRECIARYGKSPTQMFEEWGLFQRARTVAAHAVYVDDRDIAIFADRHVGVVHNPESNMKLGNGTSPVAKMCQAGVAVGLGTDSAASNNNLDLLAEADTAAKLQVGLAGAGGLPALAVVRMMTSEGARALGLESTIGSLEAGKRADIIAVDVNKPHARPLYEPFSHLVYSASGADVKHTLCDGRVLMEDYRVLALDEAAVLSEAVLWGKKILAAR